MASLRLVQSEWGERDHILANGRSLCSIVSDVWYPPKAHISQLCSNCRLKADSLRMKVTALYRPEGIDG